MNSLDKEKVASLYNSGMNMRQVGEVLGVSNLVICQFMIKHNIKARWSSFATRANLDKEQVANMYESGNSSRKISKMFGASAPTILKFMREHDIKLRKYKKIGN